MKIINPLNITDSNLNSTNVSETVIDGESIATWSSGTTYAEGAKVYLVSTHKVYESLQDTNLGNDPTEDGSLFWYEYSATNPWRAFDTKIGSNVVNLDSIEYSFTVGKVTSGIAFFGLLNIDNIQITVTDPIEGVVYDETIEVYSRDQIYDWWTYFFSEAHFITDITKLDLPPYPSATIDIVATATTGDIAEIGEIVLGTVEDLGLTQYAPEVSIVDYSRKTIDAFGNFTVLERAYSKRVDIEIVMENGSINALVAMLANLRATPIVWVATQNELYESTLLVYGYYKDLRVVIPHPIWAHMSLQIEGLT